LAHERLPIAGDPVYGGRVRLPPKAAEPLVDVLRAFQRQALHAQRLALIHPISGESMAWEAPVPDDMAQLIDLLREDAADN
jgi:23S rRNA pseudouridine1911/1915/1917 synthase